MLVADVVRHEADPASLERTGPTTRRRSAYTTSFPARAAYAMLAHIVHPSGSGFMLCGVWRSEADMRPFHDDVVVPKLAEAGLTSDAPVVSPVWSFARP
jgi:hypothetical protein